MTKAPYYAKDVGALEHEQGELFEPAEFSPNWPKKGTLADRALSMLLDGITLDHLDFQGLTQSWRLAAVIFELRCMGWPIGTVEIPNPTEENPNRYVAVYTLPKQRIAQALALAGRAVA